MESKLSKLFSTKVGVGLVFITFTVITLTYISSISFKFDQKVLLNDGKFSDGTRQIPPFITQSLRTPLNRKYKKFGVATEHKICSEMGKMILKKGGNAIDATVTSTICIGTVNCFSSGIGGYTKNEDKC